MNSLDRVFRCIGEKGDKGASLELKMLVGVPVSLFAVSPSTKSLSSISIAKIAPEQTLIRDLNAVPDRVAPRLFR